MIAKFILFCCCAYASGSFRRSVSHIAPVPLGWQKFNYDDLCDDVCVDLPPDDKQPVCMMFSRYKKSYQYFVNQCHARRTICKENIVLHLVHPSRCIKDNQFFMSIN
ncbi:hypothetical protein evm_003313 [Chilo suppressalis]|nr:hypothetical protein evm_003313 [Chilo suppressalis]